MNAYVRERGGREKGREREREKVSVDMNSKRLVFIKIRVGRTFVDVDLRQCRPS